MNDKTRMTRKFYLEKEDGSKEIINPNCQNCGSRVRGFYDQIEEDSDKYFR